MSDIKFKDITELYKRLYPALKTKKEELLLNKLMVSELEIWNYLKDNKWLKSSDLMLSDMVSDIFSLDIEDFIKRRLSENDN